MEIFTRMFWGKKLFSSKYSYILLVKSLSFLLILFFNCAKGWAQTTVLYNEQSAYFNAGSFADNGATYNPNTFQVGMWAHGSGAKQVVAWRQLKTDGVNAGTARSLRVGDEFRISVSAHTVLGEMGFALLSSPSSRGSWSDRLNNAAISVNLTSYGNWYAKYSNGSTANASTSTGSINIGGNTTYKNFVFACLLTAPDRMNITITDGTNTTYLYDLLLNSVNPITEYATFLMDDWDGASNKDIFWNTNSNAHADYVKNTLTMPIGSSNNSFSESGILTDGIDANSISTVSINSLAKSGSGTLTLSATNTYTGTTSVTAGTLSLSGSGTYGNNSRIYISAGATLNLNNVNASVQSVEEAGSGNGGVVTLGSGTLTVLGGFAGTRFQNSISGTGGLVKQGTGIMSLYGSQAYTGSTIISEGELSTSVVMASTDYTINGGTFRLAAANILPDLANVTMSSGNFAVDNNETINDLNISAGGTLTVAPGATLTINGTFTGGVGIITNNGTIVFASGAIVTTFPGSGTVTMNNLTVNNSSGISLTNPIVISGTLAIGSNNTFSLNGNTASAAIVTVGNSISTINNGNATATFTFNNSADYTFGGTLTNGSSGVLNVTKSGTGNLTLSGVLNIYTGTTTISAGTLTATAPASLPTNGNISIGNATLALGAGFLVGATKALGTLQLTGTTSYLNVGGTAGAFDLTFANSSGVAWTGTFNVFNWTPSASKNIYFLGLGLTTTTLTGQLDNFNFDNYGIGSKFDASTANKVIPKFLYITNCPGPVGGSFSTSGSWQNGDNPNLNTGVASIYVRPGDILNQDVNYFLLSANVGGTYNVGAFTVVIKGSTTPYGFITNANTGTINMTASSIINMGASSTFNNSGTISTVAGSAFNFNASGGTLAHSGTPVYSGAGAINFLGAGTFTGTAMLGNITIAGSVNFGTGSTIGAGASLSINAGGSVSSAATAPFYAAGSRLIYRTTGIYGRSNEWCASSGRGCPDSVLVTNTTILDLNAGVAGVRRMNGSFTIDGGSEVTMVGSSDSLSVGKDVTIAGTLTLGIISGSLRGDLVLGGNFTRTSSGTFNHSQRAVYFNGSSTQTVDGGGTAIDFGYFIVNNSTAAVQLKDATDINIVGGIGGHPLQLLNGNLDLNGRTLTFNTFTNTKVNNVLIDGTTSNLTRQILSNGGSSTFNFTNPDLTNDRISTIERNTPSGFASLLTFTSDIVINISASGSGKSGVNFGSGLTTVNGSLQLNLNSFVSVNPPYYGVASNLIYQTGASYVRAAEWGNNSAGTEGYAGNVIVRNGTTLNFTGTSVDIGCAGNLLIGHTNSTVGTLDLGVILSDLYVGGDVIIGGNTGTSTLKLSGTIGGDLFVGKGWTRNSFGAVNFGAGDGRAVFFNGASAGTITANGGQLFPFLYFIKSAKTATTTLVDNISISDEVGFSMGTLDLANKNVTILSNATKTARVGQSDASNTVLTYSGTGKFEIQRYLPMATSSTARRWRLLTAPIKANNAPTINAAWQEGASNPDRTNPNGSGGIYNPNSGFGTHITRSTTSGNGYDQGSTNNPSILRYNEVNDKWLALNETNNLAKITNYQGYMLFVRGDRSISIAGTNLAATPTTLRAKGEINIGSVTVPLNSSGFRVIGNPYASAISFNNLSINGGNPSTTPGYSFYMWDPKYFGKNGVGGWVTFASMGGGVYNVTANSSGYPVNNTFTGIIESGMAFIVPISSGDLIFTESCKLSSNSTTGIASRPSGGSDPLNKMDFFTSNLYSGVNTSAKLLDGVNVVGSDNFENEVNEKDAPKLTAFNAPDILSLKRGDKKISIELRKNLTHNDTIFYELGPLAVGAYQFELVGKNIDASLVGFFIDKVTGTQQQLKVSDTNRITFTITADIATSSAERFMVVFKSAAKFNSIKANLKEKDVAVEWVLSSEININRHEIQRSLDGGNTFVTIGNLPSKGTSFSVVNYSFTDLSPTPGNYLYRIKSVTENGLEIFSDKVSIRVLNSKSGIYIFPNPITSNTIQLQMNKMPEGIYSVRLMNTAGQVLMSSTINHPVGVATHAIQPAMQLAKGVYQLEITNDQMKSTILTALIQ